MTAALALAVAMICALLGAFWCLARTGNLDQALMAGGGAFVAVFGVTFPVATYVSGG